MVGTEGYQRLPLSKPVVGQSIAKEDAVRTFLQGFYTYLVSAFTGSFTFIFSPDFFNHQRWNVY